MKKYVLLIALMAFNANAQQFSPIGESASDGMASIQPILQSALENTRGNNTFLSSEQLTLSFNINIAEEDIGFASNLYLVAIYNNNSYVYSQGHWMQLDTDLEELPVFEKRILHLSETISVLSNNRLGAGEYLIFTGYQTRSGSIKYNQSAVSFVVFGEQNPGLHRVKNKQFLVDYLNNASNFSYKYDLAFEELDGAVFSAVEPAALPADSSTSTTPSTGSPISQTNLQETGVDEGDKIKTWNDTLFTLGQCKTGPQECKDIGISDIEPGIPAVFSDICYTKTQECLTSYQLQEFPAATTQLDQILLENNSSSELYLHNNSKARQTAVLLSSAFAQNIWSVWDSPSYWQGNKTQISLYDVTQADKMALQKKISLSGSKISSRIVGSTLYLLSRNSPEYYYDYPVILEDAAVSSDVAELTGSYIYPSPERPPLTQEQLLPTISFDDGKEVPLVDATDCYLPSQKSSHSYDQTIITLTAIPISNPEEFKSICISGSIETFYMSAESVYLASSQYDYQRQGNSIAYDYQQEYKTDIHKFSYQGTDLTYKGSGQVIGHLGWEQDKKSFRLGENNGVLKVATSLGESWRNDSTTRVGVFVEDDQSNTLKEISHLDKLGKPGEKLYAARFMGDRGFLVTFKVTDPLYMLDFSDPYNPKLTGELEIDGYSDYLHPIGENYLLGMGKDAVADKDADRGAWYQGVKLSLFDISDTANLKEVQSLIIGKRGTSSNALYDHHAFTWLNRGDGEATLAIPMDVHETPSDQSEMLVTQSEENPRTWYDQTHTGLYVFDINTGSNPGLNINGKLLNNDYSGIYDDRSVIFGNSIHYVHDNKVISSSIDGSSSLLTE